MKGKIHNAIFLYFITYATMDRNIKRRILIFFKQKKKNERTNEIDECESKRGEQNVQIIRGEGRRMEEIKS
jgi:hypothetical protein